MFCHTLEPPRSGVDHPCIPAGRYKVVMYNSPKFKALRPLICDVPGRSGILIHEGNTAKDTLGCVLVGNNTEVGMVTSSKATLQKLMDIISAAKCCHITVQDCF